MADEDVDAALLEGVEGGEGEGEEVLDEVRRRPLSAFSKGTVSSASQARTSA